MSEYSEYADKASGAGRGKHAKGDSSGSGENAGCMVAAPLPVVLAGTLLGAVVHWMRKR